MFRWYSVFLIAITLIHLAICIHSNDLEEGVDWDVRNIEELKSKDFWINDAQETLIQKLKSYQNKHHAKNVIYFIGDGMSIDTITASRIYEGQKKGKIGERNRLFFERFPYTGLSMTYCVDKQVADSACTASAYLSGVKANYNTLGVTANVTLNDCLAARTPENQLHSIAKSAIDAHKSVGIVTTTRITHATPAGTYAHTSHRDFESDFDIITRSKDPTLCPDIARQLIENEYAKKFKVVLGGGTRKFLPNTTTDNFGNRGERLDGRNLIHEWTLTKCDNAKFVHDRETLINLNPYETDYLLGLFSPSHFAYHLDSSSSQPTLEEMTEVAIKMLKKDDENGFFLFVEGGHIDLAHHETRAMKAVDETVELSKAVKKAYEMTNAKDTLIVVTADHGHTITISGYSALNNNILGLESDFSDVDNLPYSTLSYANGPVYKNFYTASGSQFQRKDLRELSDLGTKEFQYPHPLPLVEESHGGADVAVYANGPWASLFSGVYEQSTLPSLIGFASCMGPGMHSCE